MSPSPARSKPPPPHLSLLMNPLPEPPDKNENVISPQIYKDEPGFFNPANSQTNSTALILGNINKLKKKISQRSLPNDLTTLLSRLCEKIESLTEKQKETDKTIKLMLNRLDAFENRPTNTQAIVSTNIRPTNRTNNGPLSYADAITTGTQKATHPLPKKPTFATQYLSQSEQNKFKKFSMVICTKFGATKPFKGITTQESYNRVNKALMEVNAKQDNNPV
ncbi:hypothetical protein O181_040658 [Austropuccinia psidii MF-1]|uniref:Uncharacterized protein n=1 Tax=Austropuccinia psidii MF-1 TaxID=1389203 RepID=A0A9Q3DFT4_9BASI|nr:hypothetical protein [Austropuccinia psidii MF-1]